MTAVLRGLDHIDDSLVDGGVKGMPPGLGPTRLGDVGTLGWHLLRGSVPMPAAVIRDDVLRANSRWMRAFVQATGASICPHGKTTMAPQLFDLQLGDGAWGVTVATMHQVAICRRYGVPRVLLANQIVDASALEYVAGELRDDPGFDFYCLVDSEASLQVLVDGLRRNPIGRPLQVLLEVGMPGGRTGVRDPAAAVVLGGRIASGAPLVTLRGVEAFEGIVDVLGELGRQRVHALLAAVGEVAAQCDRLGSFGPGEVLLTAGGSAYFDEVVGRLSAIRLRRQVRVVLRSGCYLTHDVSSYGPAFAQILGRSPVAASLPGGLAPALEVWARVQSRPEPDLAILTVGKRDVSHDLSLPVLTRRFRPGTDVRPRSASGAGAVFALNDHHAYLRLAAGEDLAVGDLVALGIAHPCTTFDKWQVVLLVNEDYEVTGAIRTFF